MVSFGVKKIVLMLLWIYGSLNVVMSLSTKEFGRLAMCKLHIDKVKGSIVQCNVNKGQILDYKDLRSWSLTQQNRKYAVKITCDGGFVYLPWPFKAMNVISLEVYKCNVLGFLSELTVKLNIPDELKTLVLSDISVEIPFQEMLHLRQRIDQVPKSTDCGQLTMEKLVLKRMHYDLIISPEERDGLRKANLADNAAHSSKNHKEPCVYKHLKYVDESGSRKYGQYHLKLIPEYSKFPALEVYNMSGNDMDHVPSTFKHLHSGKFPALRHIDFSNNFLRKFEFDFPKDPKECRLEIVDLHNNQISSVPSKVTQQLKNIGNIFVDLRNNPLRCSCNLAPFRQYLESQFHRTNDSEKRNIVTDTKCMNGSILKGKRNEISVMNAKFEKTCNR